MRAAAGVHGLHHVTAIAADARENLDFYTGTLGLRLVKRTVNQDVPDTYHLFYADAEGHPGTDLTFFSWPNVPPRRDGGGLAVEVAFAVPDGSFSYWSERLAEAGVVLDSPGLRFGEPALAFRDPHGLGLALIETAERREFAPWRSSPVPEERQIRGLHAVRLRESMLEPTAELLQRLGFGRLAEERGWHRFGVDGGGSGRIVDVRGIPGERRGTWGTGGIHHVAFRVDDDEAQRALRESLVSAGLRPTPVIDRFWFRSVYFLEPGGVLFEIATDGPGFAVDEDRSRLGETLVLPPWLEPRREEIESALPPLDDRSGRRAEAEAESLDR